MTAAQKIIKACAFAFAVFLAVSIIGGIASAGYFGLTALDEIFDDEHKNEISEASDKHTITLSDLQSLEIDVSVANVTIVNSSEDYLEFSDNAIKYEVLNGELKLSDSPLSTGKEPVPSIKLSLNPDTLLKDVKLEIGAGKIDSKTIKCEELEVDCDAGSFSAEELIVTINADFDIGAGNLTVKSGCFRDIDCDISAGGLNFVGRITGTADFENDVGNSDITLTGNKEDYRVKLEKRIGVTFFDGEKVLKDSSFGTGNAKIDIDSGAGKLNVTFEKSSGE